MELSIGTVKLKNNVILAPLAGITDMPFRLLCKRFGAGMVCTEMISSHGLVLSNREAGKIADIAPGEKPLSAQLFGSDPKIMAKAAKKIEKLGADLVDINLGCSVRKVLKSKSGSALMKNIPLVQDLVRAVVEAVSVPVTVKLRSGTDANSINAVEVALACQECGVKAVTVHPRTAVQMFRGKADWNVIREVKKALKIPVIGNGDIKTPADAKNMLEQTSCDGIMVGRAALGNPWIIEAIIACLEKGICSQPEPTVGDKLDMLVEQAKMLSGYYGDRAGSLRMRKFALWYTKSLPGSAKFREKLSSVSTLEGYVETCGEMRIYYEYILNLSPADARVAL